MYFINLLNNKVDKKMAGSVDCGCSVSKKRRELLRNLEAALDFIKNKKFCTHKRTNTNNNVPSDTDVKNLNNSALPLHSTEEAYLTKTHLLNDLLDSMESSSKPADKNSVDGKRYTDGNNVVSNNSPERPRSVETIFYTEDDKSLLVKELLESSDSQNHNTNFVDMVTSTISVDKHTESNPVNWKCYDEYSHILKINNPSDISIYECETVLNEKINKEKNSTTKRSEITPEISGCSGLQNNSRLCDLNNFNVQYRCDPKAFNCFSVDSINNSLEPKHFENNVTKQFDTSLDTTPDIIEIFSNTPSRSGLQGKTTETRIDSLNRAINRKKSLSSTIEPIKELITIPEPICLENDTTNQSKKTPIIINITSLNAASCSGSKRKSTETIISCPNRSPNRKKSPSFAVEAIKELIAIEEPIYNENNTTNQPNKTFQMAKISSLSTASCSGSKRKSTETRIGSPKRSMSHDQIKSLSSSFQPIKEPDYIDQILRNRGFSQDEIRLRKLGVPRAKIDMYNKKLTDWKFYCAKFQCNPEDFPENLMKVFLRIAPYCESQEDYKEAFKYILYKR